MMCIKTVKKRLQIQQPKERLPWRLLKNHSRICVWL